MRAAFRSFVAFAITFAPLVARAQIEDPGLGAPPPPPPAATTPPPPTVITPPPPPRTRTSVTPPVPVLPPPPVLAGAGTPTVHEEVTESVENVPAATVMSQDQWENGLAASSLRGSIGLLRMDTAEVGAPLSFRASTHMQAFTQDNFIISGAAGTGDSDSRFLGDLTLSVTGPDVPVARNLELYVGIYNSSNQNTRTDKGRTDPQVILSLADVGFGLKGAGEVTRGISIGIRGGVRFYNAISGVTANFDATDLDVMGSLTADIRKFAPSINDYFPLRLHVNVGYDHDNSLSLLPSGQCANSVGNDACVRSRVVETFAYGLGVPKFRTGLAAELPWVFGVPWGRFGLDLFGEYHVDVATGDGDTVVGTKLEQARAMGSNISESQISDTNSQWLTVGLRMRPVAGLIVDLGADFALQHPGFRYGSPLPQYNVILGAAWAYGGGGGGGTQKITRTITRTIETPPPPQGRVAGVVRDAKTKKPIAGAVIKYVGVRATAQSTADDGSFTSYKMPPGAIRLDVSATDHEPASVAVNIAAGQVQSVDVPLTPVVREGKVHVKVVDDKGNAISGATVRVVGPAGMREAQPEGAGYLVSAPAGESELTVDAPMFLAKARNITAAPGSEQSVEVTLRKRPTTSHVEVTREQIVIKGTIHFGSNNATILPDGQQILDEVVAALATNPQIRKVEIQGHTDNKGGMAKNMKLSQARADAVRDYLIKQGISPSRLEAKGYGPTKPLVPNLTAANRAKNRRVEFHILEQGGAEMP